MAWSRFVALGVRALIATPLAVGLIVAMATPAHSGGGLTCRYVLFQWPGGFTAELTIANNTTATINGWAASWTFDDATTVMQSWNGSITQDNPFHAIGLGWTAFAPTTEVPTDIVVNGLPCPVV
jgi:mannan endo-1,4-beta-mannosidase